MTAELSILNKSGVVLAADSAVTIGRNNKVFNSANKLFQLSDYHPVGIMIYNISTWMGIPLEIIIKDYNKKLDDKSYSYLEEYADDFLVFLKENYIKFINSKDVIENIEGRFYQLLEGLIDLAKTNINEDIENKRVEEPKTLDEHNELLNKYFNDTIEEFNQIDFSDKILPQFKDYSLTQFKKEYKQNIDSILKGFYITNKINGSSNVSLILKKFLYYEVVTVFTDLDEYSGLVIAGYGDNQIFPSLIEIKLGEIISNKVRYEIHTNKEISHNNNALVIPFAQRDIVDTFFQGIDPELLESIQSKVESNFEDLIMSINNEFSLGKEDELTKKLYVALDKLGEEIFELRNKIHTKPIVESISYLPKEDLIELAESLVNMTSLKRRTSNGLHSVGGPIDIAVITKTDGFKWIKRKDKFK